MALRTFRSTKILKNILCNCQKDAIRRSLASFRANDLVITQTKYPKAKPIDNSKLIFGNEFADHMLVANWTSKGGWEKPHILPFGAIPIQPGSSVLHYGLEVFEGMKAYRCMDGSISLFRPELNMERFHNSSLRLSLPAFDKPEVLKCLSELVKLDQDWIPDQEGCSLYIRPTMIATEPTLGVKPPESAMMFIITGPVGPYFSTGSFEPVSLLADPSFVRAWPGGIGDCKAGGNYAPTIHAQKIAEDKGCSQCLWLYQDQVTEVGTMNFFMFWINEEGEEELITAPLNGLILPGITRRSLLELACQWGDFKVTEKMFSIQTLQKAASEGRIKEIFGSGTACVVCPIDSILYNDKSITWGAKDFPLASRFLNELTSIQHGKIKHEWHHSIDSVAGNKTHSLQ